MNEGIINSDDIDDSESQGVERQSPYSMTSQDLLLNLKRNRRGKLVPQLFALLVGFLSAFSFGTTLGWSSPVTGQLKNIELQTDVLWAAAVVPLGASIGVIPWFYIMEKFGPKKALTIQGPFYTLTWLLLAIPTNSTKLDLVMRFFSGLLGIGQRYCGEVLLIETVHKSLAARMFVFYQTSILLGVSVIQLCGTFMTSKWLSGLACSFPFLHMILLYITPESPVFLYKKGEGLAEKSLAWYRGPTNVHSDMRLIKRDSEFYRLEADANNDMFHAWVVRKAFLIVMVVMLIRMFTGYYIFLMFSCGHIIYGKIRVVHPKNLHVIFALSFYIFNTLWLTLHVHYQLSLRKCMIWSCLCSAISLLGLTVSLYFSEFMYAHLIWLPPLFGIMIVFSANIGLNFLPRVMILEYMPFQVRKLAIRYAFVIHWFLTFLLLRSWVAANDYLEHYQFFAILTVMCFLGAIFCYKFVVDTKGKSLVQVQIDLGGNPIGNRSAAHTRFRM